MEKKATRSVPSFVMLMLVAVVMSFAIAGVYGLTKDKIEAAALEAQAAARSAVMPEAAVMTAYELPEEAPLDWLYEAFGEDGALLGYVGQITVIGFGGEIEVTVGMDTGAAVTGVSVGGANFSETSGLGAKTREPAFTEQFRGRSGTLVLKKDIDSVSGASVSSGAVVSGVNRAVAFMAGLLPEGSVAAAAQPAALTQEELAVLQPGCSHAEWIGGGRGIDGWWQTDQGYIVRATGFGEGPIVVTMGFDGGGVVTGILIGDESFMESEGRGALILEENYWGQFLGRSGPQAYGDGLDAISGATVTSDAALAAINACMTFDPGDPGAVEPAPASAPDAATETTAPAEGPVLSAEPSGEPAPAPDAATEATVPAEPAPTPEPVPDAATEATVRAEETPRPLLTVSIPAYRGEPDAATEATVPEEPVPTPEPTPDAATEATVPADGG